MTCTTMTTDPVPEQDRIEEALRKITTLVQKHPPEDRALFQKLFLMAISAQDKAEAEEAFGTMMEILRDNCDDSAEVAMLKMPDIGQEELPKTRKLRAWTDHVAAKIKKLREEKGWTQQKLAEEASLMQSHVCRIEKGVHSPSWKTLDRIAKALNVSVGDIDPDVE